MGGGSKVPSAPNYTPIANALTSQSASQTQTAKSLQDFFTNLYNKNAGVSDTVVNSALGQMDKLLGFSDWQMNRYKQTFAPLEDQLAAEAETRGSAAQQEYQAGRAEQEVARQAEQARTAAQQNLEQYGVDPSQTRQQALDLGSRVAAGAAMAGAGNQAREAARAEGDRLRAQAIDVGRGISAQGTGASQQGTQTGVTAANTGLATTASAAQTQGTPTQWSGLGTSSLGTWGDILNTGYQNQLSSWKASQDASSGWGGLLGNIAGIAATKWLADGGVIPEESYAGGGGRYLDPAMSPSQGAIPDDINAQVNGGGPAKLNAGEFVMPKDVVSWLGERGMQQLIMRARKEMGGGDRTRPAQPETQPISAQGAGIPAPQGA
jgi:hypothetical protein